MRALFDRRSGEAACLVATRQSLSLRQQVRPSSSLRSETVEGLFLSRGYVTLSGTFPDRPEALRRELGGGQARVSAAGFGGPGSGSWEA